MEPIRFADILFALIVLLVIFVILSLVKKSKQRKQPPAENKSATVPGEAPGPDTKVSEPES